MQDEHFVVTTSCRFANALFDEQITFSYSIGLVVLQACLVSGMAFPFLRRSVVLSGRLGGRDHRR